jgi:O-methyltransferase
MDTKEALLYCNEKKIEGSYVECGVASGTHPIIACNTIIQNNLLKRDIYMYDTYEGLTKPGEYDYSLNPSFMNNEKVIETWKKKQTNENRSDWCCCSLEQVKKNVNETKYPEEKLNFIKGDVFETLKDEKYLPKKIAVLRLDTDWYDSSKFELEILYNRVVDGGVIIFDDYYFWNGQHKATDEFLKENNIKKTVKRYNHKTGYFIK